MRYPLKFSKNKIIQKKKYLKFIKILSNLILLNALFYIIKKRGIEIHSIFNKIFLFVVFYEFFILYLISWRIFFLSCALNEKVAPKSVFVITLTTKFYNIFFPSLLTEGIRGIKYYFAGIIDKYSIFSLVIFDRAIGFISFFVIFLFAAILIKPFKADKTLLFLSLILSLAFIIILFNSDRIKSIFFHGLHNKKLSKRELVIAFIVSFISQMTIMIKYFIIFRFIININIEFIKTVYICSASHLSQVVPISTGLFSIKDGFLFYIINTEQGDFNMALNLIVVLGSIEIITGLIGGIVESIILFKKTLTQNK